jgi:HK97 gp10 family phage protein
VTGGKGKIVIEGADTLQRTLSAAGRDLADWASVNQAAAARLAQDAASRAPRRTGRLAGSIRATSDKRGGQVAAGGGGVAYAKVQEYGWAGHNIRAQPYMRPALTDGRGEIVQLYADRVDHIVASVKGK